MLHFVHLMIQGIWTNFVNPIKYGQFFFNYYYYYFPMDLLQNFFIYLFIFFVGGRGQATSKKNSMTKIKEVTFFFFRLIA